MLRLGFFAYVEGYRGFQKGFCPRVVSRAWAVSEKFPEVSARPGRQTRKYASGVLRLNWRIKVCIICCRSGDARGPMICQKVSVYRTL